MITLEYAPVADDLRAFISCYYLFNGELPVVKDVMRADFAQIRFLVRGQGFYRFGDGRVESCPSAMVTGPTLAALEFDAIGPLEVFGISILPAGWAALIGSDSSEMADGVEDARAIFGQLIDDLSDALAAAPSMAARVEFANHAIRALIEQRRAGVPLWFTAATNSWLIGAPSPQVGVLADITGVSRRQLERLTKKFYGAPPKLLARKYRALRVAATLSRGAAWQDVVGDAFYDQSHFIRDFRRFIGMTPGQFQQAPPPVTRLTLDRHKLVGALPLIALAT